MKAFWDRASGGMYLASSVGIGIDPKAKPSFLTPYIARGAVSAMICEKRELGGRVQSGYSSGGTLSTATLKVAGKRIVEGMKIVV